MSDDFHHVLVLCMRHTHKSRTTEVRIKLHPLDVATEKLKSYIAEGMDEKGLLLEASLLSGYAHHKFEQKLEKWQTAWKDGKWCTKCQQQPVRGNNRYFCATCHYQTYGKTQIAVGSGRCVSHTGGKGREI